MAEDLSLSCVSVFTVVQSLLPIVILLACISEAFLVAFPKFLLTKVCCLQLNDDVVTYN